ncbi:MAG TPA: MFS transporter [Gemmatimonadaceae bacterium]|nr:MFS transporter [Gemmatimonadaceae bacterium]
MNPNEVPRPRLGRALDHRNFRLFFTGQSVSLVGTWITRVATSWLVYRLTNSALLLGVVGFAGQIPTLVLSPMAGVLVDRWDRHRILVWTQALSALQSLALAILALSGTITVGWVLFLQVIQGIINAFDTPARQSFVVHMVDDRADLPNAIALNSTMVNGSRIIGPSIGGIIIAAVGEGWCFMIDAISYVAVIVSLLMMRVSHEQRRTGGGGMLEELRDGYHYVSRFRPVRSALILLAIVSSMGMPYTVLMPMIASTTLHGGPHTLGFLMTASGLGAVAGALYLAGRRSVLGLGRVTILATTTFGVGLIAFGFARVLWLALLILPFIGAGFMVEMAATNTILQTITEEHLRGRVMAFYTMAFLGTAPIGSLLAGVVADRIGAAMTIMLGGVVCVAGGVWLAARIESLRADIRPIYIERGILSAVQTDAGSALL